LNFQGDPFNLVADTGQLAKIQASWQSTGVEVVVTHHRRPDARDERSRPCTACTLHSRFVVDMTSLVVSMTFVVDMTRFVFFVL
jgi:hypothetical protein